MNNYYRALSLHRSASSSALRERMQELSAAHPQLVKDATAILRNPHCKAEYDMLHTQYEALALTYKTVAEHMDTDTCNWSDRLAEF